MGSLFSGGMAGAVSWCLCYPIDYVKTLIQTDSLENPKFRSAIHCAREEFKKGVSVFYQGFWIMLVRAFVCNAAGFMFFEVGKKMVY